MRSWHWVSVLPLFLASVAPAQPSPAWSDQFAFGGLNEWARAAAVFDEDGMGPGAPVLVVGGGFTKAGGLPASRLAQWNGLAWAELGGGAGGDNANIYALQVYDDDGPGPNPAFLYVAGAFESVGGEPIPLLARWDGQAWSSVGATPDGGVIALCLYDSDGVGPNRPRLCAGGQFTHIGGLAANGVAIWDGVNWAPLGQGVVGSIESLCVLDRGGIPLLIAGGGITKAGNTPVKNIAAWNGSGWAALGQGLSDFGSNCLVTRLASFDEDADGPKPPSLFAAGTFGESGGEILDGFARWNGAQWSAVGAQIAQVDEMSVVDPDGDGPARELLVIGGSVDIGHDGNWEWIAAWNGEEWSPFGNHLNGAARVLHFDPDGDGPAVVDLVAVGSFRKFSSECAADRVARLDGEEWVALGGGANDSVFGLEAFDHDGLPETPRRLVAVGNFRTIGERRSDFVAAWDGQRWNPMNGLNSTVQAAVSADLDGAGPGPEELFVGGWFEKADGVPMWRIARWTGTSWAPLGAGCGGVVYALESFDPDAEGPALPQLFVGGSFFQAGDGLEVGYVATWDGSAWGSLAHGLSSGVLSLEALEDGTTPLGPRRVYAGGFFTLASGGAEVAHIARWTGESWIPLGDGVNDFVSAIAFYDEDGPGPRPLCLFAGGAFTEAGGKPAHHLARWDGSGWTEVGDGVDQRVAALEVVDLDGPGPRRSVLAVGGFFDHASGVPASGVAIWDGQGWSALGDGLGGGRAMTFTPSDELGEKGPGLYVAGEFFTAGGNSSGNIGRYGYDAIPCYADMDGDGGLTLFDFLALTNLFNAGSPTADCDGDGSLTLFDFLCFLNAFNAGC